jgi:hypothetical protein
MAQAVSRRPLIAEARVRACLIFVGFVEENVELGRIFLRVLLFSSVSIIPPSLSILIYHLGTNNKLVLKHIFIEKSNKAYEN